MAGRGGRGEMLLKLMNKRPGAEDQGDGDAPVGTSQEAPVLPPLAPAGRGAGRAAILARLLSEQEAAKSISEVPTTSQTVKSLGRGRAALLAAIQQEKMTSASSSSSSQSPPRTVGGSPPLGESPPVKQMAAMRVSREPPVEQPPVVMKGELGTRIAASANYISISVQPDRGMFEYEVRFEPDVDLRKIRFDLLNEHRNVTGAYKTFDGTKLYLPFKLPDQVTCLNSTHPGDGSLVQIKIIYKRSHTMSENIHFYNVLFRRIMNILELARLGRQHYNPKAAYQIPQHKLEVWPGYVTAIDEYEGGIQLCVDASFRVLRTQTVLELIESIVNQASGSENWRETLQKLLIGSSVLTRYNNKIYRIDDIDFTKNPKSEFTNTQGETITFKDYYQQKQNMVVRDLKQPLLISKVRRKLQNDYEDQLVCLVPEFCYMTGMTDAMRSDFKVMKDIGACTRVTPNQRQATLKTFLNNILENEKAVDLLSNWGLKIPNTTVELEARVVDPEIVYFGDNRSQRVGADANWNRQATTYNMLYVVNLHSWLIVHTNRDTTCANEFGKILIDFAYKMGMKVKPPIILGLRDDRTESYLRALRENIDDQLQLVVMIFPSARDDRYSAVKKLCCVERPIASQVINSRTINNPRNPVKTNSCIQKIALQINCKLGGALWSIKIPFKNAMVCGIDSYHDALKRGNSVGGFVASLNQPMTRWFSKVTIQKPGQEFVDGLKASLLCALKKYYEVNNMFPDTIIIYRDGVGDGQLKVCADYEVPQFKSTMAAIAEDYNPQMAMIITQKRINTRIFAMTGRGCNYENPTPGTIMDHTITRRNYYDFFLVSQHVREGTVTPTHYIVIHNSTRLQPDHIQRLTYKMCHLYYNWPGTVRVPAPCQYAHKLAYLVGQNIHREPADMLSDRLYFL